MNVLVLGADGYQGWPLVMHLSEKGHSVVGVDNLARRAWVKEVGAWSAIPIQSFLKRGHLFDGDVSLHISDISENMYLGEMLEDVDAIIHLAEQPSAPYAMKSLNHATYTMKNNVNGTLNILWALREFNPDVHLIRAGTMGIYGTPNVDIPEGKFDLDYHDRRDRLFFPNSPGSYYHLSKVHTYQQSAYATKTWDLKTSSFEQGVIYGVNTEETRRDPSLATRFDFDGVFGTLINRFCAQVMAGKPLSVFGTGEQKRGFATLENTLQAIDLMLKNPPPTGEFKTYNQFDKVYSIMELAEAVQAAAQSVDLDCTIKKIPNPRMEAESHYYNPSTQNLRDIGFNPKGTLTEEIIDMFEALIPMKQRILAKDASIAAKVKWK